MFRVSLKTEQNANWQTKHYKPAPSKPLGMTAKLHRCVAIAREKWQKLPQGHSTQSFLGKRIYYRIRMSFFLVNSNISEPTSFP